MLSRLGMAKAKRPEGTEWKKEIVNHYPFHNFDNSNHSVGGRGSTRIETGIVNRTIKEYLEIAESSENSPTKPLVSPKTDERPLSNRTPLRSSRENKSILSLSSGIKGNDNSSDAPSVKSNASSDTNLTSSKTNSPRPTKQLTSTPSKVESKPKSELKRITFKLNCPGGKVPVRNVPSTNGEMLRYFKNGEDVEVYSKTVSGFYKLVDDTVSYFEFSL
jgi:hypothetical protein